MENKTTIMDRYITQVWFNQREAHVVLGDPVRDYDKSISPPSHYSEGVRVEHISYHGYTGTGGRAYIILEMEGGIERQIYDFDEIIWESK